MTIQHEPGRCLCLGGLTAGREIDLECRCECHQRAMTVDELRGVYHELAATVSQDEVDRVAFRYWEALREIAKVDVIEACVDEFWKRHDAARRRAGAGTKA